MTNIIIFIHNSLNCSHCQIQTNEIWCASVYYAACFKRLLVQIEERAKMRESSCDCGVIECRL